jgi:hypothetical protein
MDVIVGSNNPNYPKNCVSPFHNGVFPNLKEEEPDGIASEILYQTFIKYPQATIITGGPPMNVAALLEKHPEVTISTWIAQGLLVLILHLQDRWFCRRKPCWKGERFEKICWKRGLCGSKLVKVKWNCATITLSSSKMVDSLLSSLQIQKRVIVAKNVCHGVGRPVYS